MTLEQIISDALETEGLDEFVEDALTEEVADICSALKLRNLLHDAVREAVHERRNRIEDAIMDQLENTAADEVEAYI